MTHSIEQNHPAFDCKVIGRFHMP